MNASIAEPQSVISPITESPFGKDPSIHVQALLGALHEPTHRTERRREQRFPYPYLFRVIPLATDNIPLDDQTMVVVGKHLSHHGLSFYHQRPIAYRRMIAMMELPTGRPIGFLLDLTWCRFTKHGWYESGGRLLQAVPVEDSELATLRGGHPLLDH
jgi:hypothetical protein